MKLKLSCFKNIPYIGIRRGLLYTLMIIAFSACDKHDFIDEHVITGEIGPQAYWEVGSSTASAGSNVPFKMQYYTTKEDVDHSEVWYGITEKEEKSVSSPWVSTFTYSFSKTISEEKRISQKIKEFPHSIAIWSDSLHAYTIESSFPVSGTLGTFAWVKPEEFKVADSLKMDTYFGAGYMQHFKDSLYGLMKFADFKKMYLGLAIDFGGTDEFKNYTDSTFDDNSNAYVYHFPKNAEGKSLVPDKIKGLYDKISFAQLIQGSSGYNVEYKRSYSIQAIMRVYDTKGTYGTTVVKLIDVN